MLQSESCTEEIKQQFCCWCYKGEANQAAYAHAERLWSGLNQLKQETDIAGLEKVRQVRLKRNTVRALGMIALIFFHSC